MSATDFAQLHHQVVFGRSLGRIIWQPRIGCWFTDRRFAGQELPAPFAGMDLPDIYRKLNCSARLYEYNKCFQPVEHHGVHVSRRKLSETDTETTIHTPVGKQVAVTRRSPNNAGTIHVKWEISDKKELKVATWRAENRTWRWDQEAFEAVQRKWGNLGAPTVYLPRVNIQDLYINTMGVENAIYALHDFPSTVQTYFGALDECHDRLIEVINASPVNIVNFGDNIHASTLPPSLLRKYVLPAYQRRCERLHAHGKFVHAHWDGDTKPILPLAREAGLDGLEAITPQPQGDVTLEELKAALGDSMSLIDGLPAILFDSYYPVSVLEHFTHRLIELFAPKLILGISDELSSTGDIERIRVVGGIVDKYNASKPCPKPPAEVGPAEFGDHHPTLCDGRTPSCISSAKVRGLTIPNMPVHGTSKRLPGGAPMSFSSADVRILRELGGQVAEIAHYDRQPATVRLWQQLNCLHPARPMVMIDQIPWHEMNVDDELTLRTEAPECRQVEGQLRKTLYRWKHMPVDYVVEPRVTIAPALSDSGFGLSIKEERAVQDTRNDVVGHFYHDQLQTSDDLEKIKTPILRHDTARTAARIERWQEVFAGILEVGIEGVTPMFNIWDLIVMWRGAESVLFDLSERPEHMHRLMAKVTAAYVSRVEQLDSLGLLARHNRWVHCSGAFTDELPAPDFNPARPRTKDTWAAGMAQIFSSVSPAMHQEFELDYVNPIYARFGLVYYGCCEPLHDRLHLIRRIPNLRKISMSPWVEQEAGAEALGSSFVFSRKPSPAFLAKDTWDPNAVERDLRETVTICARHNCPVELILKDISTVRYQPQRLWQWAEIAHRVVGA